MNSVFQDLRCALRTFGRNPGFAVLAVAALALGISANTALFSVVDGVLFRPLRFEDPDFLVRVYRENPAQNQWRKDLSPADFVDLGAAAKSFEGVAAIAGRQFTLSGSDEPEQVLGMLVTADFFAILRASPALGRVFSAEEYGSAVTAALGMVVRPGEAAVILGHALWQRQFGGRADLVGSLVKLDGRPARVVGVLRPDFAFTQVPGWGTADCWVPQAYRENENPRARYLAVVARRRADVAPQALQAELDVLARRLEERRPQANAGWAFRAQRLQDTITGDVRQELLLLWGAVGFVMLIACANTANLLLARGVVRRRELTVRASLGASRLRLIRQPLTETVVLASAAGLLGLLFASWGVGALRALSPPNLPRLDEVAIEPRAFAFTLLLAAAAGLLSGLAPALRASTTNLICALKDGGTGFAADRRWPGRLLVVAEVALAMVLLVGAGLMVRSFLRLQAVDLGFDARDVLTVELNPGDRYRRAGFGALCREALNLVEKIPGVRAAGLGALPLGPGAGHEFNPEGQTETIPCGLDAPTPACYLPARRASILDPIISLRHE